MPLSQSVHCRPRLFCITSAPHFPPHAKKCPQTQAPYTMARNCGQAVHRVCDELPLTKPPKPTTPIISRLWLNHLVPTAPRHMVYPAPKLPLSLQLRSKPSSCLSS
mmetsp:Transcript_58516/g.116200  ORF Transcript_58516/g.116200 Transcript_58516/m.116200 type:complete len:106 (+) Transcript_58516:216-533(+)